MQDDGQFFEANVPWPDENSVRTAPYDLAAPTAGGIKETLRWNSAQNHARFELKFLFR